jgi:hypothetical protein
MFNQKLTFSGRKTNSTGETMFNYKLTFNGYKINSAGDLLDVLASNGATYEKLEATREYLEATSFQMGCFNAYEHYLTFNHGEPTRHEDGHVEYFSADYVCT